ncbi:Adenylyl cyclase class-3/4/guanylyl cyclase [Methylophilaceae bacterium]
MNDKIYKTSICSILFLDIIDYSKKSDSEKINIKNQLNRLINQSLKDVESEERIIFDAGDGAAIAYMGSPKDVILISFSIRNEILKSNILSSIPMYVRFGIDLGPVSIERDINGQPNIIGDGIDVAQRMISFASPNQIVLSRSYYEVASRVMQEISQLFDYSGIRHDKNVREHEIYAERLLKDEAPAEESIVQLEQIIGPSKQLLNLLNWFRAINWRYVALAMPALMTFAIMIKSAATPREPVITIEQTSAANAAKPATLAMNKDLEKMPQNNAQLLSNETLEKSFVKVADEKPLQIAVSDNQVVKHQTIVGTAIETKSMQEEASKKVAEKKVSKMPAALNQSVESVKQYKQPELDQSVESVKQDKQPELDQRDGSEKQVKQPIKTAESARSSAHAGNSNQKSVWNSLANSVKQGKKHACTQVEIVMNQCHH